MIRRHDWVRATARNGSTIVGQAVSGTPGFGGTALIGLAIKGNGASDPQIITINVNHWYIEVLMASIVNDPEVPS